jgi:hypothetical protein
MFEFDTIYPRTAGRRAVSRPGRWATVLTLLALVSACGSDGLYRSGVIGGDEATDIIADSVVAGLVLCQARQGTLQNQYSPELLGYQLLFRELAEPLIQLSFDINPHQGYRLLDVKQCADRVRNGLILSSDCKYEAFLCYLNPVNPWTGGN